MELLRKEEKKFSIERENHTTSTGLGAATVLVHFSMDSGGTETCLKRSRTKSLGTSPSVTASSFSQEQTYVILDQIK